MMDDLAQLLAGPAGDGLLAAAGTAGALVVLLLLMFLVQRRWPAVYAEDAQEAPPAEPVSPSAAFRLGLAKTRQAFAQRLRSVLRPDQGRDKWLAELEETLLLADVGMATTQSLVAALRARVQLDSPEAVLEALKGEVRGIFPNGGTPASGPRPLVILVAGVNGVGKTTSIGKLAHRYRREGKSVLLVAADTFRAAAIEQLEIWAGRVDCEMIKHQSGSDPAAVVFDGVKAAKARGADVVIIDTAGRLHVKVNLMEELKKLVRVVGRELPGAPHESLLVLDATTGQNALNQARLFREALPLTGLVLTKLDGTAKGGAVLAVVRELGLPIRYVGLGEKLEDLREFEAEAFTEALFEG